MRHFSYFYLKTALFTVNLGALRLWSLIGTGFALKRAVNVSNKRLVSTRRGCESEAKP